MRLFLLALLGGALALPLHAQTTTGTLGPDSPQRDEGIPYAEHSVTLAANQRFTARLESVDFDTYLVVRGPGGVEFTNDDYGSTSVSQVEFVAPRAGTYTVWATAYDAEVNTGAYTLVLTPGATATVAVVEGRLDPTDTLLPKGEYADTHERTIDADAPFDLELRSYGFDGYLAVRSPSGIWYRNDDAGGDTSFSRLAGLDPEAGTWHIVVTSAGAEEVGAYDLRVLTYTP